jgi:CheY-like chemotaxis protein
LIAEFPPDVLVSDANFGEEQDGLDLARLATAGQPDLAVIFMTGYSSSMRQLQELGERTLAKPFSRDDLYAAVLPLLADDGASQGGEVNG